MNMSDGDGEGGRDGESIPSKNIITGEDEFSRAISTIAVAQLCELTGFQGSIQRSAIDVFSDIAIRYIYDLGKTSKFYAGISGRTDCNVFDILQGLEDLGSSYGFTGASNIGRCLANSGVFHELTRYMSTVEEISFAQSIPRYPIHRCRRSVPSFQQISETSPGKHIPNWLPAFPDPHTYIQTPIWNEKARDPKGDKIKQAKQRRKAELSLLNLRKRLANVNSEAVNQGSSEMDKQASLVSAVNPFLAKALQFGEKEVSQLVYPDETAAQETSVDVDLAPVIEEALKSNAQEPNNSGSNGQPRKRMTVQFKVGTDKKTLTTNFLLGTKRSGESTSTWLLRDDDRKDDKKRRANVILKESMENPHELHQL
ncbi:hypothetical protein ZOSMA_171G00600 [Zostera marina]|uniref:Transcription initiation factor TFIID subunit 8 n=1 Tax=Zostera marina TaxID=29655 RepID=A0A0K9PSP1_ZOSMR|nr:hypothetical protein ZOSMA_171G00600 [Zostera marina]